MTKFAELYMRFTPLIGVSIIIIILLLYISHQSFEGMEGEDKEEDPPTTEQAYLANNILAKIAVDDPGLSNPFNISIIRELDITSPAYVIILDKDVSVKQKLKELAGHCKVTRPKLPDGFEYATLPNNLFKNESSVSAAEHKVGKTDGKTDGKIAGKIAGNTKSIIKKLKVNLGKKHKK